MNEKAIQDAYKLFQGAGYGKSIDEFQSLLSSNQNALNDAYKLFQGAGYSKSINEFKTLMGVGAVEQEPVKKKEFTESASKLAKPTSVSSSKEDNAIKPVQPKQEQPQPTKPQSESKWGKMYTWEGNQSYRYKDGNWYKYTSTDQNGVSRYETKVTDINNVKKLEQHFNTGEFVKGYPGKEQKDYLYKNGVWKEADAKNAKYTTITDPSRVAELNRHFGKSASTSANDKIFVGYPGKEANEYKVSDDGVWMKRPKGATNWSVVTNEGSINSLNKQFGKEVDPKKKDLQQLANNNAELNDINNKIDSYVTSNLIDDREGAVVGVLSKQFPQFNFEESKAGADRMVVSLKGSNRPEDKIEISLDNWSDSDDALHAKRLRNFMKDRIAMQDSRTDLEEKEGYFLTKKTEQEQAAIKGGMGERQFEQPELVINKDGSVSYQEKPKTTTGERVMKDWEAKQDLMGARKEYIADKSNYMKGLKNSYERGDINREEFGAALASVKVDDEEIKRHDAFLNDINIRNKNLAESKKLQAEYIANVENKLKTGEITQEQYDSEYKPKIAQWNDDIQAKTEELRVDNKNLNGSLNAMNRAVGENRLIQEQIGSTGGAMMYNLFKSITEVGKIAGMTPEEQDKFIRDWTGIMTTQEWMGSKDRNFAQQAAMSVTSGLGSALFRLVPVVGQATSAVSLGANIMFPFFEDPEMQKIPKRERFLYSFAYGLVGGYLEKIGLDELLGGEIGKKLILNSLKDASGKIVKDAPKEFIENAIISATKSRLESAGIRIGTSMAAEGATEGLQKLAEVSTKEVYDSLHKTDYFNNKAGWEIASDVLYDAALGAVGGGMVSGAISGASLTAQQRRETKYKDQINAMIAAAETSGASDAIVTTLKAKVIRGELTGEEAKYIARNFNVIKSKVDEMPADLSEQGKAASLDLMMEKDGLEKQIQGKDPNLVKPQTERITEINNRLQEIGKEYAVQKQSTNEVPVQSEPGVGQEMGQGVSQPTSEKVTGEAITEENKVEQPKEEEVVQPINKEEVSKQPTTQVEEQLSPELQSEMDAFESLLFDEGLPFESVVDEEAAAIAPELDEEVVVPPPPKRKVSSKTPTEVVQEAPAEENLASNEDLMDEEDLLQEIENSKQNIEEHKRTADEAIAKVKASKLSETAKKNKINKIKEERDTKISETRDWLNNFKSDLKKVQRKINKANAQQPAAQKPAKKQKAPTEKQLQKEYIDRIDELKEQERLRYDRRIVELENKRNTARGEQRSALTNQIDDLKFEQRKRLAELEAKKSEPRSFARFRKSKEAERADTRNKEAQITKQMNKMSAEEQQFEEPTVSHEEEINPAEDSKQPTKLIDKVLKFLGLNNKSELNRKIEYFDGIPMIMAMSDILSGGTIKDSMGNPMVVDGGLLFNTFGRSMELAWAGVSKEGAQKQYDEAVAVYEANKELFDRLWAEGKIPNGLIPMAVMRMGNTAVNSNEAVFRYVLPYIQSLPLENREAALNQLKDSLKKTAEGNAAIIWYTDLAEKLDDGEISTIEELRAYLEGMLKETNPESTKYGNISKFLNSIDKNKKGEGVKKTLEDISEEVNKRVDKIIPYMIINYINENNITTLDGFFEEIIDQSKKRAAGESNMFSLPIRAFIFTKFFSKEGANKNSLEPIKALLNGVENPNNKLFTSDYIYSHIGDPSMMKAEKGDVVAVMGVDVLNGGVEKATHNNYGYGPKGRLISFISNPKHGIDVFPEFRAKAARIFKASKAGKYPTLKDVADQTGGAFFMDSAFRGTKARFGKIADLDMLIGKLRFAFPEVSVTTTEQEFNDFIQQEGVKLHESDGAIIYGVTKDGRIFLNPNYETLRTPIHEFGHIWIDYLRSAASGSKGTKLLQKGFELVDGTPEYKRALKEYGNRELALEEALVELMAVKGDTIINAAKKSKFKSWMNATFKYIKDNFIRSKKITNEQIKNLTLDEFINVGLADLFSGERIHSKFDARTAEGGKVARHSQQSMINKIVAIGRQNNVSDTVIAETLKKRGFKKAEIEEALAFEEKATAVQEPNEAFDDFVKSINDAIKGYAKGARKTLRAQIKAKRAILNAKIKSMETTGSITTNQAKLLMEKLNKLNLSNKISVQRFLDFTENVFKNAEYVDSLLTINNLLPAAKRSIKSKLGIAENLVPLAQRLLSIKPTFIPMEVFEKYKAVMEVLGQRKAELTLPEISQFTQDVNDILQEVDSVSGLATELADKYYAYEDKVMDENGKVDYTETINKMLEEGVINDYDKSVMKKYRNMIEPVERTKKSNEELQKEKDDMIEEVKDSSIDSSLLPTSEERKLASKLSSLLNSKAIDYLTSRELRDLLKVIDNINNGFITNRAQMLSERLTGIERKMNLVSPLNKIKVLFGEKIKSGVKSMIGKSISGRDNYFKYIIEGNPVFYLDEVFKNFKTKPIFENLYKSLAHGLESFNAENRKVLDTVENINNKLYNHFKRNHNKITLSKYKMMTYLIQNEFNSNPDSKQVNPAIKFLEKTIEQTKLGKTYYSDADIKMFEQIIDEFSKSEFDEDGKETRNIDADKLYNSFSSVEKEAINGLRKINDDMTDKAVYTAAIIRGTRINPINNYISLNVIDGNTGNDEFDSISALRNVYNNPSTTSTRAKTLIDRTGKVSAINFDPFSSVKKSASSVLMDYHLTTPIREGKVTLSELEKSVKEGEIKSDLLPLVNALRDSYNKIIDMAVGNSLLSSNVFELAANEISRQGYRALLASIEKAGAELISNMQYIMFKGASKWITGTTYAKTLFSTDAFEIMKNVNSLQTNRVYSSSTVSSQFVSSDIFSGTTGLKGTKAMTKLANAAQTIYEQTLKRPKNLAESTADALMSAPDMIMMRPLWFGSFATEFEKVSGSKVDFDKIANNDETYMQENADAIEQARNKADDETIKAGSTSNLALGIQRNMIAPDDKTITKWYKRFNSFMSKFNVFEYMTARSAILNLYNDGQMSKREAAATLAGVVSRMTLYSLAIRVFSNMVVDMAAQTLGYRGDDEDEEDDKKTIGQRSAQALTSTFSSLLFGRNFGNAARGVMNIGIERFNKNYLEALRNGEYDPYEDALQYSIIPFEKPHQRGKGVDVMDMYINTLGSASPFIKTGIYSAMKLTEDDKKTEEALARQEKERAYRVPLELAGTLGYIPLYKTFKKIQMDWLYGELDRKEKVTDENVVKMFESAKRSYTKEVKKIYESEEANEISHKEANDMYDKAEEDLNKRFDEIESDYKEFKKKKKKH